MKYVSVNLPVKPDMGFDYGTKLIPLLRHPVYAWLGWRPAIGQHTTAEHDAFKRWAKGRTNLVEIGVAEGVSALALRESMDESASLYLIDPFHLGRVPFVKTIKRTAHRIVNGCPRGKVLWIEKFSQDAIFDWKGPIDLLLIDGDHQEAAVERDWIDWSQFVTRDGAVIFHDARLFEGGWTVPEYGPVKVVDRLFRNGGDSGWKIAEEIHSLVVLTRT